jgi:OOP family OmpA-OmpF porin
VTKTLFALAFTLILAASIPFPVSANEVTGSVPRFVIPGGLSLSPTVSEYYFSESENRKATQSYGLKIGYDMPGKSFADSLGVEGTLSFFSASSNKDLGSDASGFLFRLDALYPLVLGERWMPYLAIGAGVSFIDDDSSTVTNPLLNYGLGLKYFLNDSLALRADARHLVVYNNDNIRNNFEAGIGISYYFGRESKNKIVPLAEPKKVVLPDAQNNRKAEKKPEKLPAPQVAEPQPTAEIIVPPVEKTPPLPAPQVAAVSPPPALVSAEISKKKVVATMTIDFEFDTYEVKSKYFSQLRELAGILRSSPDSVAEIEGHTDSVGKERYNLILSLKRAEAVRKILTGFDVEPGRISTIGYGMTRPLVSNATSEGRQRNRRAVTTITITRTEAPR